MLFYERDNFLPARMVQVENSRSLIRPKIKKCSDTIGIFVATHFISTTMKKNGWRAGIEVGFT